jgi:hypothetical protein
MNDTPEQDSFELGSEPFSPQGPRSKWASGSRRTLIGCGALIVLLGVGSVVFLVKAKDLFGWMMGELEAQVEESLPANITDAERQELALAFDAVVEAVKEDRANPMALQDLQKMLRESLGSGPTRLSRAEVRSLIAALDRVSGRIPSRGFESVGSDQGEDPEVEPSNSGLDPTP